MTKKTETMKLGINNLTDDGLTRVRRTYERGIEDGHAAARSYRRYIKAIRTLQLARLRLRMRYGAVDDHLGTHIYDHHYRRDEAPTYSLARQMDHGRWQLGKSHVLDWDTATRDLPAGDPRRKDGAAAMDDPRTYRAV